MYVKTTLCIALGMALLLCSLNTVKAQNPNVCTTNSIENNLVLVNGDMMPYECQADPRLCPRAQNEFWNVFGGKGSACWNALVEDGWGCIKAAAIYAGATGCRACVDGVGVYQCPSTCSDVISKCGKAIAIGNCFSNQAEPQCFGESGSCTKWAVDSDVLEEQSGVSQSGGGGDGNGASELIGSVFSFVCAIVFMFMISNSA